MGTRKNRKSQKKMNRFSQSRSKNKRDGGVGCSRPGQCTTEQDNIEEGHTTTINNDLIEASEFGHPKTEAMLLEKGADVNAKNKWGRTALIWASSNGRREIVAMLKEWGAE